MTGPLYLVDSNVLVRWVQPEDSDSPIVRNAVDLLPDDVLVHEEWRRLLVEYQVSGVQVHDTHLVAVMNVYGVKHLLTFNTKDFRRFTGIEALHPADVVNTA